MKKQVIACFLTLSLLLALVPAPARAAEPSGQGDRIEIGTAEELRAFAADVNSGNDYTGKYVVLTADIDLGGEENPWTPIGCYVKSDTAGGSARRFNGTFDGDGHKVTGIFASGRFAGLFGYVTNDGVIQNVGVEGVLVTDGALGGIAGINSGIIRQCYSNCTLSGTLRDGSRPNSGYVGGIVGMNHGIIENCYSLSTISLGLVSGGIAGNNNSSAGRITNCYNMGMVTDNASGAGILWSNLSGMVSSCYYLAGTASVGVGGSSASDQAKEKTLTEFAQQSTFADWDFERVWTMDPVSGRPVLNIQLKWLHEHTYSASQGSDGEYHWLQCTQCGYADTAPHTWGPGMQTVAPTEETAGVMTYTCTDCGSTKEEPIPQLPHTHKYGTDWLFDVDNHWRNCTGCGESSTLQPHTWDNGVETIAPSETSPGIKTYTCTVCGSTWTKVLQPLDPLPHTHTYAPGWEHDFERHWHRCSDCLEPIDFASHSWDEGTVTKEASLTDWGLKVYTCSACGFTKTEVLPATIVPGPGAGFTFFHPAPQPSPLVISHNDGFLAARYDFFLYLNGEYFALLGEDISSNKETNEILDHYEAGTWEEDLKAHPERADIYARLQASDRFSKTIQIKTTGTVSNVTLDPIIMFQDLVIDVLASVGDGTVWLEAPTGTYTYQGHTSVATRTGEVYVDNTPPRIILAGASTLNVKQGTEYHDPGAFVTDNLDPNVEQSLVIDASQVDTSRNGAYQVTYTATDHVGNTATVNRTVIVDTCTIHIKDDGQITRQATHESTGVRTYYCRFCGIPMGTETIPMHIYEEQWHSNDLSHWHECPDCDSQSGLQSHTYGAGSVEEAPNGTLTKVHTCTVCGYVRRDILENTLSIGTAQELLDFAASVNSGEAYHNTYIQLTADIDLSGIPWPVIGDNTYHFFAGVFDGHGHRITGLTVDGLGENNHYGLFGYTRYLPIIQNVWVDGSINATDASSRLQAVTAGGIVGLHSGGTIKQCFNSCSVQSQGLAGGIAGTSSKSAVIEDCYNTGNISCVRAGHSGGIAGHHSGTVKNCYNYGAVQGIEAAGGVAGLNEDGIVVSSYYLSGTVGNDSPARFRAAPRALSAQADVSASTGEEREELDFMLEETFVGWDFTDVWTMNNALGRPTLRAVPETEAAEIPTPDPDPTPTTKPTPEPDPTPTTEPSEPTSPPSGGGSTPSGPSGSGETVTTPPPETSLPPAEEQPNLVARVETVFSDIPAGKWYTKAVQNVYEKGLMQGVSPTAFSPFSSMSRGMMVTVLHRMDGAPETAPVSFGDVRDSAWYAAGVSWAASNGVVYGYSDGRFGPTDDITREQVAVMLYRYAAYKGFDTAARADLSGYEDLDKVHGYAREAMEWAVAVGLIHGRSTVCLAPRDMASRAEVAQLLSRFMELQAQPTPQG